MNEAAKNLPAKDSGMSMGVEESISLDVLLVNEPINSRKLVDWLFTNDQWGSANFPRDIRAHCSHEHCDGIRRYVLESSDRYSVERLRYCSAQYICTNCKTSERLYIIKAELANKGRLSGYCTKIYQEPTFGPPIPKRLFKIIGEDNRDYFLQARRAIARGLGIGAYAYYRRIVENTKFELVSTILETAKALNSPQEQITLLEKAQKETQFSKALALLQDVAAIPAVLLIDGHNPLALLHDLLSEGIHQLSDAECLERAKESEIILSEIAERMQIALTERNEVKSAIKSIMHRKQAAKTS